MATGPRRALLLPPLLALLLFVTAAAAAPAPPPVVGLRAAAELLAAGRLQEARDAFATLLEADSRSDEARRGLAAAHYGLGHEAVRRGDWDEARRNAEKAVELRPGDAAYHHFLGAILFRQGDYYYARGELKRALEIDPGAAGSRELLGDVLYQEGDLYSAIDEWQAAATLGPSARVSGKIDRARRENDVEGSFSRTVSRHFLLQSEGPVPRWMNRTILDILEQAFDGQRDQWGTAPAGDITVILYPGEIFHDVTRSPKWMGGRFDGKIRIPVGGLQDESDAERLRPVLVHELAHAFSRSMVPHGLPLWLEEGLAEYAEGQVPHRAPPFESLEAVSAALRAGGDQAYKAYMAAAVAVAVLIDEVSFWNLRRTLEAMGRGVPFPEALAKEALLGYDDLEESWRKRLH
jgi:tetratricopeptide (TPR) repeat protein